MLKVSLLVLFGPLLLVAAVVVSPLALVYFLFDRACDCIEEFKPRSSRRIRKRRGLSAKTLAGLLNRIPTRGNTPNDKQGGHSPV